MLAHPSLISYIKCWIIIKNSPLLYFYCLGFILKKVFNELYFVSLLCFNYFSSVVESRNDSFIFTSFLIFVNDEFTNFMFTFNFIFFCILDFFITFSTINYQYGFFYDFYLTFEYILYCYNASFYLKLNCILKYISF